MNQHPLYCLVLASIFWYSCSHKLSAVESTTSLKGTEIKPDYADLNYWAAHPYKKDLSDSVPAPLISKYQPDSTVDIFFVHPTSYTTAGREHGWNAPINDMAINNKTDGGAIFYQASIFNEGGRVFAPRYRQAHLSAYYFKTKEDSLAALQAFDLAYLDVKTAFEYYLAHYNNGRPIVIASHSQGSTHTIRLLKEFFDNKLLKNKLVVAYVVGMAVDPAGFSSISVCSNPYQTGCICSWRTYRTGYRPPFVEKETFVSVVTNPLTWDTTTLKANNDLNKGGILLKFNKTIPRVSNAKISNGILWTDKPRFFGNIFYSTKNYHIGDYNLYYMNVRENLSTRIGAFWKN